IVARGAERLEAVTAEIRSEAGDDAVLAVTADVASADEVGRSVDAVIEHFGGVDVLVNNAGRASALPFLDADDGVWQDALHPKLFAALRFSRLVVPSMQARGGGRIVNILNLGSKAPGARSAPTSVSRAAGLALTKVLSRELAADRILVNAICIGTVESDQWV